MKSKKVFNLFSLNMLSLVVFSCGEDISGDDDENGSGGGSNNLTTGQIEIKVYPDNRNNKVSFGIGAKSSICKMTVEEFNNLSANDRKFAMSLNS
jgi:hypothetical protein